MLEVAPGLFIADDEIEIHGIRAQGAGGQNVNKVSSAVHLRFDIRASSLPDDAKQRLLQWRDERITNDGVIVIKAQRLRTRERNLDDARDRLRLLVTAALRVRKKRRPTRPSVRSRQERVDSKTRRGSIKKLRKRVGDD